MNTIKNKVQLVGHLGATPELKELEGGKKLTRFSIATNESYRTKDGETKTNTSWHTVIAWGALAQNITKITQKGNEIVIVGKLAYNQYIDKDGRDRKTAEIVASEFMKMGKGTSSSV